MSCGCMTIEQYKCQTQATANDGDEEFDRIDTLYFCCCYIPEVVTPFPFSSWTPCLATSPQTDSQRRE